MAWRAVITAGPGTFVLLSGEPTEYLKTADSGTVRPQGFCPRCGTALYSTLVGDDPKARNVRVGAVRQRKELVPRRQLLLVRNRVGQRPQRDPEIRQNAAAAVIQPVGVTTHPGRIDVPPTLLARGGRVIE